MHLRSASTRILLVAACFFPGISAAHSAPDKTSRDAHGAIVFGFDLRGTVFWVRLPRARPCTPFCASRTTRPICA